MQYARSIAESIPLNYYSTGGLGEWLGSGTNTNEPYVEFLDYMLDLDDADLPNTISISYGDDEDTVPDDYAVTAVSHPYSGLAKAALANNCFFFLPVRPLLAARRPRRFYPRCLRRQRCRRPG